MIIFISHSKSGSKWICTSISDKKLQTRHLKGYFCFFVHYLSSIFIFLLPKRVCSYKEARLNMKENLNIILSCIWINRFHFFFISDSGVFATEEEGNFFRFFNLQSVSADAMRMAFDKLPGVFQEKIERFKTYCMSHPRRPMLLRNYPYL